MIKFSEKYLLFFAVSGLVLSGIFLYETIQIYLNNTEGLYGRFALAFSNLALSVVFYYRLIQTQSVEESSLLSKSKTLFFKAIPLFLFWLSVVYLALLHHVVIETGIKSLGKEFYFQVVSFLFSLFLVGYLYFKNKEISSYTSH